MSSAQAVVPELYCTDFAASLRFYVGVLGFEIVYSRPEERFAYLRREGAELMIEQTVDPERTLVAGELSYPLGRGVNLQIRVEDAAALHMRVLGSGSRVYWPLEERWYRTGDSEAGNRQFVAMDPDGYLLRFSQGLGTRPLCARAEDP